jgi:hypothetical protein
VIWRGLWDGQWDGAWEGADETLPEGFLRGYATVRITATARLTDAGAAVEQPRGGWRRPWPAARYGSAPTYVVNLQGVARVAVTAEGNLVARDAEMFEFFRNDEAALLFAVGW